MHCQPVRRVWKSAPGGGVTDAGMRVTMTRFRSIRLRRFSPQPPPNRTSLASYVPFNQALCSVFAADDLRSGVRT